MCSGYVRIQPILVVQEDSEKELLSFSNLEELFSQIKKKRKKVEVESLGKMTHRKDQQFSAAAASSVKQSRCQQRKGKQE